MATRDGSDLQPQLIERLRFDAYSALAMLAGMELDVFTPLNDAADSIRADSPQAKIDYVAMSQEDRESGALSMVLTDLCPQIKATVADLPTMTPVTQRLVDEDGATDRVQVVSADVVRDPLESSFDVAVLSESLGGTYDLAVLSALIQVISRDQAQRALHNTAAHMLSLSPNYTQNTLAIT